MRLLFHTTYRQGATGGSRRRPVLRRRKGPPAAAAFPPFRGHRQRRQCAGSAAEAPLLDCSRLAEQRWWCARPAQSRRRQRVFVLWRAQMDAVDGSGSKRPRSASSASGDGPSASDVGDEAQADDLGHVAKRRRAEVRLRGQRRRRVTHAASRRSGCRVTRRGRRRGSLAAAAASSCQFSRTSAQAAALPSSAGALEQPELLSPGTTISVADVHDVILHALLDGAAPKWLRLQARLGYVHRVAARRCPDAWTLRLCRRRCRASWCSCSTASTGRRGSASKAL